MDVTQSSGTWQWLVPGSRFQPESTPHPPFEQLPWELPLMILSPAHQAFTVVTQLLLQDWYECSCEGECCGGRLVPGVVYVGSGT
mmetsp:Transcript_82676/g.137940  ORF Transcript_82676/g.137940 Transcript_82676/m.137940 type:complete len:85 (-) Transcript_82676:922-1176(-)